MSARFADALMREAVALDVARAHGQHRAYCAGLRKLGFELVELPALEAHPDCCFVEDTAIIAGDTALLTRPGAPSRRGEVDSIADALTPFVRLERMEAPATLDGGDCLWAAGRWYIGRSERTNAAGIARAREVFGEVVEVPVQGALHLKSVCSEVGGRVFLWSEAPIHRGVFDAEVVLVPDVEAANVVGVEDHLLMAAGFPRSQEILERAGFTVHTVDNSEIRRADGALTCLSLRLG
jgi:dimethylargininase